MVITFSDLARVRKQHAGKKVIFVSGSFDVTHAGHILFFEDAKRQGDVLVAMVGSDAAIRRNKGPLRPILNEHLRLKMIDSLKPVDYVFIDDRSDKTKHALDVIEMVFKDLKPDAYVVNDDGFEIDYRKEFAKKHGIPMIVLPRTAPPEFEGVSTTKIIDKIKKS